MVKNNLQNIDSEDERYTYESPDEENGLKKKNSKIRKKKTSPILKENSNSWVNEPNDALLVNTAPSRNNKTRRSVAFNEIKYNNEGLDEDFEDTPWVPPSIQMVITLSIIGT